MIDRDLSHVLVGRVEPHVVRRYLQDVCDHKKMAEPGKNGHEKYTHALASSLCEAQWRYQQATRLTLITQEGEQTFVRPTEWLKAPPAWCSVGLAGY